MAGARELLSLPADRARPDKMSYRGGYRFLTVPRTAVDALRSVGRQEGATLFMTLVAIVDVWLAAYTGQEDLAIGSPVAGRSHVELEKTIGCFTNMVVLRTDVSGDPTFRELLGRVRATATEAFARQDIPFEKLVEALRPPRRFGYNPLFQVALVSYNAPGQELALPGLEASRMPVGTETSKFDLTVFAVERAGELHLGLEFSRDMFDEATADRMLGHLERLMGSVVAQPDRYGSNWWSAGTARNRLTHARRRSTGCSRNRQGALPMRWRWNLAARA
jgi:non-ribosomal peptide synthetase component F